MQYISDVVRSSVPCNEAGRYLGMDPDMQGRCRCFFHGGTHRNLKLYGERKGFYCFVCHESGDVIKLVKEYTKCSWMEAVEWLNDTFTLNLNLKRDGYRSRQRRAAAYAKKANRGENYGGYSGQHG